jgi:hypothetical protein
MDVQTLWRKGCVVSLDSLLSLLSHSPLHFITPLASGAVLCGALESCPLTRSAHSCTTCSWVSCLYPVVLSYLVAPFENVGGFSSL